MSSMMRAWRGRVHDVLRTVEFFPLGNTGGLETHPHKFSYSRAIMQSDIENTLERIQKHKGIEAVLIINGEGAPVRSIINFEKTPEGYPTRPSKGYNEEEVQRYAAAVAQLTAKARSVVRDLDPQNDLKFLRVRSKRHEVMVAPDKDFLLVAVQDTTIANKQ